MIENNSRDGRLDFEQALKQLVVANFSPRDANGRITTPMTRDQIHQKMSEIDLEDVTQGSLWMSVTLQPSKQKFKFTVVDTQQVSGSPVQPLNMLLTMQDSFLISHISYFLQNYAYQGGTTLQNPDFASLNTWEPITYPSRWLNNGTTPAIDPGCAIFWMGSYLSFTVNKRVLIPRWDCYKHYKAGMSQATPNTPLPTPWPPDQYNQHDGSTDGFVYMQPNIVIGGGRDNVFELYLASNIPPSIAPFNNPEYGSNDVGFVLQACMVTRGILMQNSTNVK